MHNKLSYKFILPIVAVVALVLQLISPAVALAVITPTPSWPTSWISPSQCSEDVSGDENPGQTDLVGDAANSAIGFQEDSNFFYFRERVVGNPKSGGVWKNTAWVVLMQTTPPSYQYLLGLNGDKSKVEIWRNAPQVQR